MGFSNMPERNDEITGSAGDRPEKPTKPRQTPPREGDTAEKRTELETAVKKTGEEIVSIQTNLREGDQNDTIPTDAAPLGLAAGKVEELLQTSDIQTTLNGLKISKDAAKTAILKLAGGIAKKIGMLNVEKAFAQTYTPAIKKLTKGLNEIVRTGKIHQNELKIEFNRLTGAEIFAGNAINAAAFITYLSTRSEQKISNDIEEIKTFYELSGKLQNAKAELAALETEDEPEAQGKSVGKATNIATWLKQKSVLSQKSFPKKELATYLAETIPESIRESDKGREILQYLQEQIEKLAEENDMVTVKPDGTVEVTKAAKLAEAAAAAQAAGESGETAAEEQNPIMAMLAGFISFIKKLIEGFQKLFGKNPPEDQTGENGNPNPAEPGQEAEEKPQNGPGNKPENEAESADENAGQKEELRTALGKRELAFSEEQTSDTLIKTLSRHKDGTKFKADSWENYLGEFLSDEDAKKIREGSLSEQQIIELITTKPNAPD